MPHTKIESSSKTNTSDCWNFSALESFDTHMLSQARLYLKGNPKKITLLMVHGGYHGAWCWVPFMQMFAAAGLHCAALDLRGHGNLTQDKNYAKQGVADMAVDVMEAATFLNRPVVLVGHSLGALIAMAAARKIMPVGLILMAPSPPGQLKGLKPLDGYPEGFLVMPPQNCREKFLGGYDGDIDELIARLCPESPRCLNDRYRLHIRVNPEWVKGPTLCLSAGCDLPHLHPPGQDAATAEFFGGDYHMIEQASHNMMLDAYRESTANLIINWFEHNIHQKHHAV